MAQRLEGKQVAEAITQRVREKSEALRKRGVAPTLAIVRAGENPSDLSYEFLPEAETASRLVRQEHVWKSWIIIRSS